MANAFVHIELNTTDLKNAETFYSHLFEWQMEPMPIGEDKYIITKVGEGTGGGMMNHPVPGAPSPSLPYVLVNDIHASTSKARSLGAKVMRDDPAGAALGLRQA